MVSKLGKRKDQKPNNQFKKKKKRKEIRENKWRKVRLLELTKSIDTE